MIRYGKKDTFEVAVLGRIRSMHQSGYTSRQIAKQLNDDDDFSRFGKPWCFQTICRILAREKAAPATGLVDSLKDLLKVPAAPAGCPGAIDTTQLNKGMVFVFGSNEAGVHGAGAALDAVTNHGAIMGQGLGRQGQSYAIATKGKYMRRDGSFGIGRSLPLDTVKGNIEEFIRDAEATPDEDFKVSQIGCGYAGFTADQIAPLFAGAPDNCYFDSAWEPLLGSDKKYWGTF